MFENLYLSTIGQNCKKQLIILNINGMFLFLFSDLKFLVRVAALQDIYDVLGKGSAAMQNIQRLPWESQADYEDTINVLTSMASSFTNAFRKTTSVQEATAAASYEEYWPSVVQYGSAAVSEVS